MESREGKEPENQAERLRQKSAAKSLCRQLAAQFAVVWGMAMPKVLLTPGREKGSPGEVMQSALSKIRT